MASNFLSTSTVHRLAIAAMPFHTRMRYLLFRSDTKKAMCEYSFSGCFAVKSTRTLAQPYLTRAFDEETQSTTMGSNWKSHSTDLSNCSFVIAPSASCRSKDGPKQNPPRAP